MTDFSTPVYTLCEIGLDGRRYFTQTVAGTAAAVDFMIKQGLRWHHLPDDVKLKRRPDHYEPRSVVVVTIDLADPQMAGKQGPFPQWEIRKHATIFTLQDTSGTDPMRVDEGWEAKPA